MTRRHDVERCESRVLAHSQGHHPVLASHTAGAPVDCAVVVVMIVPETEQISRPDRCATVPKQARSGPRPRPITPCGYRQRLRHSNGSSHPKLASHPPLLRRIEPIPHEAAAMRVTQFPLVPGVGKETLWQVSQVFHSPEERLHKIVTPLPIDSADRLSRETCL